MTFLEDLMNQADFGQTLENLAPHYREHFSLPEIHQLGLVAAGCCFQGGRPPSEMDRQAESFGLILTRSHLF